MEHLARRHFTHALRNRRVKSVDLWGRRARFFLHGLLEEDGGVFDGRRGGNDGANDLLDALRILGALVHGAGLEYDVECKCRPTEHGFVGCVAVDDAVARCWIELLQKRVVQ